MVDLDLHRPSCHSSDDCVIAQCCDDQLGTAVFVFAIRKGPQRSVARASSSRLRHLLQRSAHLTAGCASLAHHTSSDFCGEPHSFGCRLRRARCSSCEGLLGRSQGLHLVSIGSVIVNTLLPYQKVYSEVQGSRHWHH